MTDFFVDESKSNGYTLVAAAVPRENQTAWRKEVLALTMPGQRRIHFTKESNARRRLVLSTFVRLGVRARIYHVRRASEQAARDACLTALARDAATSSARRIVLEADESIVDWDRRLLFRELEALGIRDRVSYVHETAAAQSLLCLPDAIAWSFARGGDWRRRIEPLIIETRRLA